MKNVVLTCLVISSADLKDLDRNTVRAIVVNNFPTTDNNQITAATTIVDTIWVEVEMANGKVPAARPTRPTTSMPSRKRNKPLTPTVADDNGDGADGGEAGTPATPPPLELDAAPTRDE